MGLALVFPVMTLLMAKFTSIALRDIEMEGFFDIKSLKLIGLYRALSSVLSGMIFIHSVAQRRGVRAEQPVSIYGLAA